MEPGTPTGSQGDQTTYHTPKLTTVLWRQQTCNYSSWCLHPCSNPRQRPSRIQKQTKEMLGIVHRLEKCHYYAYDRLITVETEHKPLKTIFRKHLHKLHGLLPELYNNPYATRSTTDGPSFKIPICKTKCSMNNFIYQAARAGNLK